MTRSRAIDNLPNEMMATYYGQRKGAGLIVTEGVAPTPAGLGYPRIPGIFSDAQIEAWKKVAAAVHKNDSKIFMQLMHTGRIGHTDNLPEGLQLVGPTARRAGGQVYTDSKGLQDNSQPLALTEEGIREVIAQFVTAAKNAVAAGFDGVEIHGANGYLVEQFLHPVVNDRDDNYGGSIENRVRFAVEIAEGIAAAIGKEKVGIRISPLNRYNDQPAYDEEIAHQTYAYLAARLNEIGIAYLHLSVNQEIPQRTLDAIRTNFQGTIILCNDLTPESAEAALHGGLADVVAFGRAFLANPDLDERIAQSAALNTPDFNTFFTPGAEGYIDYPNLN